MRFRNFVVLLLCLSSTNSIWAQSPPNPEAAAILGTVSGALGSQFGAAVAFGRINAGTEADIIVGAPYESSSGGGLNGSVTVFSGATFSQITKINGAPGWGELLGTQVRWFFGSRDRLGEFLSGSHGGVKIWVNSGNGPQPGALTLLNGVSQDSWFGGVNPVGGTGIARLGDINGDGLDDLIIGALADPTLGVNAGAAYIFDGKNYNTLRAVFPTVGATGFGNAVGAIGDINYDGTPDYLVTSRNPGTAFIYSGVSGALLHSFTSPQNPIDNATPELIGDINCDGAADILISSPNANGYNGVVWVLSGAAAAVGQTEILYQLNGTNGLSAGLALSAAGDINADGFSDFIHASKYSGKVSIISGQSGTPIYTISIPLSGGFTGFGAAISGGRDVNGDGIPDVLVGRSEGYNATAIPQAIVYDGAWLKDHDGSDSIRRCSNS